MTATIQALLMSEVSPDPYWPDVVLLCHFDGTNGSTTYVNQSTLGSSIANSSGTEPALSTTQAKFGPSSLHYSTSATTRCQSAASADYRWGTGDFTVEFWYFPTTTSGSYNVFEQRSSEPQVMPNISQNGNAMLYYVNGSTRITGTALTGGANTWYHIALSRISGTTKLFCAGTSLGSYSDSNNYATSSPVVIGSGYAGQAPIIGYIDEIRLSKGIGRYSSNFTPPTSAFPNF